MDLTLEPDMYHPDPAVRELATIRFLDDVFGRGFLLRWAKMNDCGEWMAERLRELAQGVGRSVLES